MQPTEMLNIARDLAAGGTNNRGRPKQDQLRAAVNRTYYTLLDENGNPVILIEAKRIDVDNGDELNWTQVYDYASDARAAGAVVVTNDQYRATRLRDRNVVRPRSRNAGWVPENERPPASTGGIRERRPDGSTATWTGRGTDALRHNRGQLRKRDEQVPLGLPKTGGKPVSTIAGSIVKPALQT